MTTQEVFTAASLGIISREEARVLLGIEAEDPAPTNGTEAE